jgi:hypothetical protein
MSSGKAWAGAGAPKVSDTHVVALYDSKTGKIKHLHSVTVFEGGRPISEKEAIAAARVRAAKAGHKVASLSLKTSKDATHAARPHHIDLKSGKFVALSSPVRKGKRKPKP